MEILDSKFDAPPIFDEYFRIFDAKITVAHRPEMRFNGKVGEGYMMTVSDTESPTARAERFTVINDSMLRSIEEAQKRLNKLYLTISDITWEKVNGEPRHTSEKFSLVDVSKKVYEIADSLGPYIDWLRHMQTVGPDKPCYGNHYGDLVRIQSRLVALGNIIDADVEDDEERRIIEERDFDKLLAKYNELKTIMDQGG